MSGAISIPDAPTRRALHFHDSASAETSFYIYIVAGQPIDNFLIYSILPLAALVVDQILRIEFSPRSS